MNASELRIGNYLLLNGQIFIIDSIWIGFDNQNLINIHSECSAYGDSSIDGYKLSECEPMEITQDILRKCGFLVTPNLDYSIQINGRIFIWFNHGNPNEMDLYQDGKNISFPFGRIKYLHQLQNLYFALTGKELEVSL